MGQLSAFEEDTPTAVRAGMKALVLVRSGDSVRAVDALCPHKFGPLQDGTIENGCIVCPIHDAHFSCQDGSPRAGDEWAGTLETFPCFVEEGAVFVEL